MTTQLEKFPLVATPDTVGDLFTWIDGHNSTEKTVAMTAAGMAWNLAAQTVAMDAVFGDAEDKELKELRDRVATVFDGDILAIKQSSDVEKYLLIRRAKEKRPGAPFMCTHFISGIGFYQSAYDLTLLEAAELFEKHCGCLA